MIFSFVTEICDEHYRQEQSHTDHLYPLQHLLGISFIISNNSSRKSKNIIEKAHFLHVKNIQDIPTTTFSSPVAQSIRSE